MEEPFGFCSGDWGQEPKGGRELPGTLTSWADSRDSVNVC